MSIIDNISNLDKISRTALLQDAYGSRARRGEQIAAVVTARKLAVLVWHLLTKEEDFLWARPSLSETKRRTQELKAEMPAAEGQCEHAYPYH